MRNLSGTSYFLAVVLTLGIWPLTGLAEVQSCRPGKPIWVSTEGSLMMALRSNSCHFWSWAAQNKTLVPAEALTYTGIVAGDAHHENFFHVFVNRKRTYVLNDMDDSGEGPLFMDFLKFLGVSRSVSRDEKDLSTEQMLAAYAAGLTGKQWRAGIPTLLAEDAKVTRAKLDQDYLEKIKKNTSDGLFDAKDGLVPWKELNANQRKLFTALEEKYFRGSLPAGYEISDRAMFAKEGGGSGGAARFWYYLKKSADDRQIIEFKSMSAPAVSLFMTQRFEGKGRVERVASVYWDGGLAENFAPVGDSKNLFWMRPRLPGYIDFNAGLFRQDRKQFAELSYYIAYKLGTWHGKQGDGRYGKYLTEQFKGLSSVAQEFVSQYLKTAEAEQRH